MIKRAGYTAGGMAQGALVGASLGAALGGIQGYLEAGRSGQSGRGRIRAAMDEAMRSGLMGSVIGTAISGGTKNIGETISSTALTKAVDVFATRAAKAVAPQKDDQRFFKQAGAQILVASLLDELRLINAAR